MNIRRKLEVSVAHYLRTAMARCGLTIVEGHTGAEPQLPYLVVYCGEGAPAEDLEGQGEWILSLVLHLKTSADDESRKAADARMEEVTEIMGKPEDPAEPISDENPAGGAIRLALNKPASGPDVRKVRGIYLHQIWPADDRSQFEEGGAWHDQATYEAAVFEGDN